MDLVRLHLTRLIEELLDGILTERFVPVILSARKAKSIRVGPTTE